MKRKTIVLLIPVILAALGAWYVFAPSQTPAPQPPLVTLTSGNLRMAFYGALREEPQDFHLVLLVSPT